MASRSRVARGRATNTLAAEYWAANGFPGCASTWGSQPGRDVKFMLGLAPEVKATSDGDILAALRQAEKNSDGDLPFVLWRPDGYGPEKIDQWVMAFRNNVGTRLLRAAGYGTPLDKDD